MKRRGYDIVDERDFKDAGLSRLAASASDVRLLVDRGYPFESTVTFVGNHFRLDRRSRIALSRIVSPMASLAERSRRLRIPTSLSGQSVQIDGFNQIITLEVALCGSPVLRCMDGTYRDLAGLRGTYHPIEVTRQAIAMLLDCLASLDVVRPVFWLDAPVSNSGRLKALIASVAEEHAMPVSIEMSDHVDGSLYERPLVATSDSVILDRCPSWVNLLALLLPTVSAPWIVDIEGLGSGDGAR